MLPQSSVSVQHAACLQAAIPVKQLRLHPFGMLRHVGQGSPMPATAVACTSLLILPQILF